MSDFYVDTEERYVRDPEFRAAVDMLQNMAREHGFTPGELKQIAFKAAVELEFGNFLGAHRVVGENLEPIR